MKQNIDGLKQKMAANLERLPAKLEEEGDEDEDDEDGEEDDKAMAEGGYDPKEYENLVVSSDVMQLFGNIVLYTPVSMELDFKLKPFIPDFIPSVGDIDAFIKVPRPDSLDDGLGLLVLDEPSATKQSDASLLALRFRALTKQVPAADSGAGKVKVASDSKDIDNWIENIRKLHQETQGAPLPTQRLPDIDHLMQEWDPEFEELLDSVQLPPPDLDCDLAQYATILCALLEIPVHASKIASLHQLFTLYNEFRNSQHFKLNN